jgi:hypothetical protein
VSASFCSCRDTKDYLAILYIVKNYGPCTYDYILAYRDTLFNCCVEADMAITSNGNVSSQGRARSDVYMIAQNTIVFHDGCWVDYNIAADMGIRIYYGASHYRDPGFHDYGASYRCRRVNRINEFKADPSYTFEDFRARMIIAHTTDAKECKFCSASE